MLLGVDVGGTFTDAALLTPDGLVTAKAPRTPRDQSEGVLNAVVGRARSAPARGLGRLTLRPRDDGGHQRAARGQGGAHRAARHRGLHRPRGAGPPGARRALPAVRRPPAAAGAARAARAGARAHRAGRRAARAGRGAARASACARAVAMSSRSRSACCGASATATHEQARGARCSRTSCPRCTCPPRTRRPACSASTSAAPPRWWTPRSRRCCARYLERLAERARDAGLPEPEVMLSGGGVASAATAARHGSWTVLSGPAGGAVGAARSAERADVPDVVCLDMGGTSCDVSVAFGGRSGETGGREVGGRALALPMVDVHTIGAGGGSVAWRDAGGALRVGPRSAGAEPGSGVLRARRRGAHGDGRQPAARLPRRGVPAGGRRGTRPRRPSERAVGALAKSLGLTLEETAAGIVRVAGAEMARAVRVMTVERGIDPRELALLAFGGAGPLHACADRRRARHAARGGAAGLGRAVRARADRVRAAPRAGGERAAGRRGPHARGRRRRR